MTTENSESKQMRREMQEKLNKQYIDTKVHPIIEPMATALFTQAGGNEDPVSTPFFSLSFLDRLHAQLHQGEFWKQTLS